MSNKLKNIGSTSYNHLKHLFKPSFLSSKNSSISLDIGSTHVKAISLEKDSHSVYVTGFSCERVKADMKNAIKKALFKLPVKKKELAISISGQSVVLRYVNMPIMSHAEVVKAMSFELEKYIPFNKDEINFDFSILRKNQNSGKMLVLIAAAKKELVDIRMTLCQNLGFQASFIDVCPLAVANYVEYAKEAKDQEVCAVVNLGASISSVGIIENGQLVLSRDIFIGGNDFTKRLSESLNKSFEEAEEVKLNSLDDNSIQALDPVYNNLIKELKVSFDFYETQANRLIDRILITGGAALLKGIGETFKQSLGQEVGLITFKPGTLKLKNSLNEEDFRKKFNFYTIALGMAIRDFK
ncbi:type IV pilus assembly protein PilM [Candidatus Omnitrophota bacterium]